MHQKSASIAAALAVTWATLSGCKEEGSIPAPSPDSSIRQLDTAPPVVEIARRSVSDEAQALQVGLNSDGVIRLSPGMSKVLAECFETPSSQPLAAHWRAGGSTEPDHKVLLMQSLLLKLGFLGDNNPNQLDGIYGDVTKQGVTDLQQTFGAATDARGHSGVEFSCRSIAQALRLIHRGEGQQDGLRLEFENPRFDHTLFGGTGSPGVIPLADLIVDRAKPYPTHFASDDPRNSTIARSVQGTLYNLGHFEPGSSRAQAVDGIWGPMSQEATRKFQMENGDARPSGIVGPETARLLFKKALKSSLGESSR